MQSACAVFLFIEGPVMMKWAGYEGPMWVRHPCGLHALLLDAMAGRPSCTQPQHNDVCNLCFH
jgi:hypothetical protein